MQNPKCKIQRGFSLIELVLAIGLFAVFVSGVAVPLIGGYLSTLHNQKEAEANMVLTETWEAVRAIRNNDWDDISNGTHGLSKAGGFWAFSGTSDTVNGFTRGVTISNINRNLAGDIVESGGINDDDSKKIVIDLSWNPTPEQSRSIQVESLLTNYLNAVPL